MLCANPNSANASQTRDTRGSMERLSALSLRCEVLMPRAYDQSDAQKTGHLLQQESTVQAVRFLQKAKIFNQLSAHGLESLQCFICESIHASLSLVFLRCGRLDGVLALLSLEPLGIADINGLRFRFLQDGDVSPPGASF